MVEKLKGKEAKKGAGSPTGDSGPNTTLPLSRHCAASGRGLGIGSALTF